MSWSRKNPAGDVLDSPRVELLAIIEEAKAGAADGVILGCPEVCLGLDPGKLPLVGFDSTAIHGSAAAHFAFSEHPALETGRKYA